MTRSSSVNLPGEWGGEVRGAGCDAVALDERNRREVRWTRRDLQRQRALRLLRQRLAQSNCAALVS